MIFAVTKLSTRFSLSTHHQPLSELPWRVSDSNPAFLTLETQIHGTRVDRNLGDHSNLPLLFSLQRLAELVKFVLGTALVLRVLRGFVATR